MRAPLHRRPRGRLSVAPLPPWSALRAPRTPPMLLLAPRPAPAARASVRQPLRPGQPPPGGLPWPAGPAPMARGGGAVAALKPAPARQTGRGESWATRVRALGGAEAAEKSSQVKSNDNPQTNCARTNPTSQRDERGAHTCGMVTALGYTAYRLYSLKTTGARAAAVAAAAGRDTASTDGRIRARRRARCDGAGACDGAANDAGKSCTTRARGPGSDAAAAAASGSANGRTCGRTHAHAHRARAHRSPRATDRGVRRRGRR